MTTAITDRWPSLQEKQWLVTLCACAVFFVLEIPMCYSGGVYLFTLLDWNTAAWAILLVGFAEVIIISWVYGKPRMVLSSVKAKALSPPRLSPLLHFSCRLRAVYGQPDRDGHWLPQSGPRLLAVRVGLRNAGNVPCKPNFFPMFAPLPFLSMYW